MKKNIIHAVIAGKKVEIMSSRNILSPMIKDYISDFKNPDICIEVLQEDIDDYIFNHANVLFPKSEHLIPSSIAMVYDYNFIESVIVLERLAESMLCFETLLIHSAAILVENRCYVFLAPSGTGKTTHVLNWLKCFPDTIIINGDKPFVNAKTKQVYGTPWCGKEGLNKNISAPLAGIISLERGTSNSIERITFKEILPVLLQQTYIPNERPSVIRASHNINFLKEIPCYKLKCTVEEESAVIAYNGIRSTESCPSFCE